LLLAVLPPELDGRFNRESHPDVLGDQRHLTLRDPANVAIFKLRSVALSCFRDFFFDKGFTEATPPRAWSRRRSKAARRCSSPIISVKRPTSHRALNSISRRAFRAEGSSGRRHLAEFTHFEGELGFITFTELLTLLEEMVSGVTERIIAKAGPLLRHVNPHFVAPSEPFLRMDYEEAIRYLNEHQIYKDEDTKAPFVLGDDIPEAPERRLTDAIGRPILLCRFPAKLKSFYMQAIDQDEEESKANGDDPIVLTESVDLLLPGVGEVIGGSMRTWDHDKLMAGYAREGIDPTDYYWYTDLRKFGSVPHGGWGLGVERYLCWLMGQDHIRNVTLYPRSQGRCKP